MCMDGHVSVFLSKTFILFFKQFYHPKNIIVYPARMVFFYVCICRCRYILLLVYGSGHCLLRVKCDMYLYPFMCCLLTYSVSITCHISMLPAQEKIYVNAGVRVTRAYYCFLNTSFVVLICGLSWPHILLAFQFLLPYLINYYYL